MSCTREQIIGLEKRERGLHKVKRKIELVRNQKLIFNKHGFNENIFKSYMKEALQTYMLHGKIRKKNTLSGVNDKGILDYTWINHVIKKYMGGWKRRK